MWLTIEELAEQYRDEARRLDELIERARREPNADVFEQDRRMRILRMMRRENYDVYRHLLWLIEPNDR